jgi:hypothetical protein
MARAGSFVRRRGRRNTMRAPFAASRDRSLRAAHVQGGLHALEPAANAADVKERG